MAFQLEQFIAEVVRAMPQFTVAEAVSAATQLAEPVQLNRYENFDAVAKLVSGLQLRSKEEWTGYGYEPDPGATPVEVGDRVYYLATQVNRPEHSHLRLMPYEEGVREAQRELITETTAVDRYGGFLRIPKRRITMLGNLWKIGVALTWDDSREDMLSWLTPGTVPSSGEQPHPEMTEFDAWFVIRLNPNGGRDIFPEIARQVATLTLGDRPVVHVEAEAVSYLVLERLWVPPRLYKSHWFRNYLAGIALPEGFSWTHVFEAAQQVEDLLRGVTEPVTAEFAE